MVTDNNTKIVLSKVGLHFESSESEKYYVNYKGRSGSQVTSLTS